MLQAFALLLLCPTGRRGRHPRARPARSRPGDRARPHGRRAVDRAAVHADPRGCRGHPARPNRHRAVGAPLAAVRAGRRRHRPARRDAAAQRRRPRGGARGLDGAVARRHGSRVPRRRPPGPRAGDRRMTPSLPPPLLDVWVYLSGSPLLWLTFTVVAYVIADWISAKSGRNPLVNPILLAIALVSSLLFATGTSYRTYFDGAQFVHFLLGPATVALAIPLVRHFGTVRSMLLPMLPALVAGSVTAIVSAVGIAALLG